jgi:hypothetical protein
MDLMSLTKRWSNLLPAAAWAAFAFVEKRGQGALHLFLKIVGVVHAGHKYGIL